MYNKYITNQYNHCIQCRSVMVQMDFSCLAVIDVTSFWQTLQMKRIWLDSGHFLIKAPRVQIHSTDGHFIPSKSTVPSPLSSASLTMVSISLRLMCSPISLIMADLSSSVVISPSPSMSNWAAGKNSNAVCKKREREKNNKKHKH